MDTLLLVIPYLAAAPQLDGRLEEPVWAQASVLRVTHVLFPEERVLPDGAASVRLFHDGDHVYIGARLPAPHGIRAENLQRDQAHKGMDDLFEVVIGLPPKPFSRGYAFAVNPSGALSDAQITQNTDRTYRWDADWTAAVSREDDSVWTVEMALPLSDLAIPSTFGLQVFHRMSLPPEDGFRQLAAWAPVSLTRYRELNTLPSVELEGSHARWSTTLLPAFTVIYAHPFVPLDYHVLRWGGDSLAQYRIGMDVNVQGPSLRLAATVLPDFANVEVDQPEILEDPYALLYLPEKRPFFYEGLDFFNTYLRPLYTRRFLNVDAAAKGEWQQRDRVQGFWVRDRELGNVAGLAWGREGMWSPRLGMVYADSLLVFSSLRFSRNSRSFRVELGGTDQGGWGIYTGGGLELQRELHNTWAFFWGQHLSRRLEFPTLFRTYGGDVTNGGIHTGVSLEWPRNVWKNITAGTDLFWGDLRYGDTAIRFLRPEVFFRVTPVYPWFVGAGYRFYGLEEQTPTGMDRRTHYAFAGLRTGLFFTEGRNLRLQVERGHEEGIPVWRTELNAGWTLGPVVLGGEVTEWRTDDFSEALQRTASLRMAFRRRLLYVKVILQHALDPDGFFPYLELQTLASLEWGGRSRLFLVFHPLVEQKDAPVRFQGAFKIAYAYSL